MSVDDFVDDFENRQIVNYQVAKSMLRIFDLMDILVKICQLYIDLIQINLIGIKLTSMKSMMIG